jgi:probable HAF family extracellular repeat protein
LLAAGLALGLATGSSGADYEIVLFEVGTAPITGARGLNDTGCQAGYYQTDPLDPYTAHAIRRCGGVIETVDPPGSVGDRRAFDINDSGTLVGSAARTTGLAGFELADSGYSWVEFPGAVLTALRGINNLGDVVGEYENADGVRHAFARLGGSFINVDVPGAASSKARSINDHGDIVGHYDDPTGGRHGFLRTAAGGYTTIDYAGATQTLAGGINNAGDIVGTYLDAVGTPHGFLITATGIAPFDVPGAVGSIVTGLNEAGQLAGETIDGSGIHRGFVATPILFADGFESGDLGAWSTTQP